MPKLAFLLIFISLCIKGQTPMNTEDAASLRSAVKVQAEATQTVSSDFLQFQHFEFMSAPIESSGTMIFKSPNMVKWQYLSPDNYIVYFNKETLTIVEDGKKKAMDMGGNAIFKQLNQLILASIKGDMFADEAFNISYFKKGVNSEVHFMPVDEDFAEFIKAIHINFSEEGIVQEVKLLEPTEDYTKIVFKNRKANQPLSDELFSH